MGLSLLIIQLVLVSILTIFLLTKYTQLRNQSLIVLISTFFGWFFSFLIIIVLPLDVAITFYKKCLIEAKQQLTIETDESTPAFIRHSSMEEEPFERNASSSILCEEPKGFVEDKFLLALWRIVYWSSQFLTWMLLPMMQSYSKAGEFTMKGRLKYAFYNNLVYYGLYFVAFTFLLFYAISRGVSLDFESLKVLVISASNTWGLFLLVILLGYGLVEVPRHFWRLGIKGYRLQRTYFDLDKLSSERNEAEDTIREVYIETKNALNLLKSASGHSRDKVKQIATKFPHELAKYLNDGLTKNTNTGDLNATTLNFSHLDTSIVNNDFYLIKLNRRVINAVQNYQRCQAQWMELLELAFYLEDVEVAESTGKLPSKWLLLDANNAKSKVNSGFFVDTMHAFAKTRFLWHVTLRRPIMQCLAIYFATMTAIILWSECTFFIISPQLSLAARILHVAARGYHYKLIQMCAIGMILYLCISAYYTIFCLRIYRYYRLDPNHMTDANSLIFSAMLICRLTAPLCLNFLGMIHLDSHITANKGFETQFTKLMGHLDIIPLIAKGINIYLPIVIVVLCLTTWLRLGTRFLHNLGIDQFLEEDEMAREMIQSGKALVSLERSRINRIRNREERGDAWRTTNKTAQNRVISKVDVGKSNEREDTKPILSMDETDNGWQNEFSTTHFDALKQADEQGLSQKKSEITDRMQPISPQSIFDDI